MNTVIGSTGLISVLALFTKRAGAKVLYHSSFLLALILSGCMSGSAQGPLFGQVPGISALPPAEMATVCIYRPSGYANKYIMAEFFIGDRRVAALRDNGFTMLNFKPGAYTIIQKWRFVIGTFRKLRQTIPIDVVLKEGAITYLRLDTRAVFGPSGDPRNTRGVNRDVRMMGSTAYTGVGSSITVHNEWNWNFGIADSSVALSELVDCHYLPPNVTSQ